MPVEDLRRRFAGDLNLYPTLPLGGHRDPKQKESPSVISIASNSSTGNASTSRSAREPISVASVRSSGSASTSSTVSSPPAALAKPRKTPVVISSDESENSDNEVEQALTRFDPSPHNIKFPEPEIHPDVWQSNRPRVEDATYKSVPTAIPVPSNPHLPPATRPPMQSSSLLTIPPPGSEPIINMAPAEAEQELKTLMEGSTAVNIEAEINPEDMVVKNFREKFKLLPHQALGREWMSERETGKNLGGILADDMGLGKTIQTLTRIVDGRARKSDSQEGWAASTLVVCPLALVGQWVKEVQDITVGFTVKTHHGQNRTADPSTLRSSHIIITTYDVVKSEYDAYQSIAKNESKQLNVDSDDEDSDNPRAAEAPKTKSKGRGKGSDKAALFKVKWWRVVLDEAHNIKNEKTKGAIACCALEAKYRWCLTGTPMQNNVQELYSLFKFLRIKPLNDRLSFETQIGKPLKTGRNAGQAMKKLRVILQKIMLRRTKDQTINGQRLIELPARNVNVVSCPFDSAEQEFYSALENKMSDTLEKLMTSNGGNSAYMSVLLLLLRLRQACNHPILVTKDFKKDSEAINPKSVKKGESDKDADADDLAAEFEQLGVTRKCQFCTAELPSDTSGDYCITCVPLVSQAKETEEERPSSAKIRMILKILDDIKTRSDGVEKTIIFSQFTSMLDLIEPFLKDERIRYVRYDGTMKPADREAALTKIKEDSKTRVILISFKAGSTGLNLTACSNVILVDLWWNPALEDQAFDRAHRFGQNRDVHIFKLKIDNTVEDRILELQERKRALTQNVLAGAKHKGLNLGFEELLALLKWGKEEQDSDSDD